jgi:Tfp pilus assembly protein PilW
MRTFNCTTRTPRRGLSIVEAMISLVIAATLLTACGMAFVSTAKAMNVNDEFFRATQSARISLVRITAHVRRGAVDEKSTTTNLHVITDTNQDITYKMDATTNQLQMINNTTGVTYVLARNVQTPTPFSIDLGTDYNNAQCVSRVSVNLLVRVGNNEVRLSGSAAPRRNLVY